MNRAISIFTPPHRVIRELVLCLIFTLVSPGMASAAAKKTEALVGRVPRAIAQFKLQSLKPLPATNHLWLVIGLPLRNQPQLDQLLVQLNDPSSTNYHR